ncbi:extracellular solute-binding protein (family 5) [Tamaricihabitans halophyticus]|uniref:Extracellular solute-binding protein (Family 5) n=1 Tax=Tamaricihabitans halophyticus TaxID=1262583 RepID=A0A4R2QSG4_9PSEU|nr:ABC transporter substrate-binding protein [Tamaricihabitans halophyticus]TCP49935.1 extracellular solute-binding protein (family 5) [Tamaricihabitans halophyticus]
MRIPALVSGTAVLVVLAACSPVPLDDTTATSDVPGFLAVADPAVPAGGTLNLQVTVDNGAPTGLDPQLADVATSWQLMSLVYEPLVTVGPDFAIEPVLAKRWETPSPTEYVFHLREGVRFSNGRLMTAEDVVGSFNRLLEGNGVWKAQIGPLASVSKIDENKVSFRLSMPYEPFLASLANVPAAVLPMKEIENGSLDLSTRMLGTGPYVVDAHRQDVSWRFKRRDDYWARGKPAADTVNVLIAGQEQARMAALQSGSADLAMLGNVDSPRLLSGARDTKVAAQATTDFYYLMLNSNAPGGKFDDPRVREAINIALDRPAMAESALAGLGEPTGATPAGLPGSCDPATLPSATADLDRAKQLLRAAGHRI